MFKSMLSGERLMVHSHRDLERVTGDTALYVSDQKHYPIILNLIKGQSILLFLYYQVSSLAFREVLH